MPEKKKLPFLMYKGHPLVRLGNVLYYGSMADDAVVMLQILTTKTENGITLAEKISIQLISTDPDIGMAERILKKSEKKGLYNAMDLSAIWLDRALEDSE